jgi:hypothetical protein
MSYNHSLLPEEFYLVLGLNFRTKEALSQKKFDGLLGIGGSVDCVKEHIHTKRMVLCLPGEETFENNQLYAIDYHDADVFCYNNLEIMRRVLGHYGHTNVGVDIMDCLEEPIYGLGLSDDVLHAINTMIVDQYDTFRVNTFQELWGRITECIGENDPESEGEMDEWAEEEFVSSMVGLMSIYEYEAEWVVSDRLLHVPDGCSLIVLDSDLSEDERLFIKGLGDMGYKVTLVENANELIRMLETASA